MRGGGGRRTYVLRRAVPPTPAGEGAATRGLIGALGKKILKVVAFRILDPLFGEIGKDYVERWEREKRPYRLRPFTASDYLNAAPRPFQRDDWERLTAGDGRALLLVHGTFSRAHTAFGGLPSDFVEELHDRYAGRVFAFDHPTASEDPLRNARWLVEQIPDETRLRLDILCHSRGGLVSRVLCERQEDLPLGSRRLEIRQVLFVATPNAGTVLADDDRMGDFVDTFTTLLNLFPPNGVTEVLEGVITVAKHLACATLARLDGLQSMRPAGPFLAGLNQGAPSPAVYRAVASDFEPAEEGLRAFVQDRLMDRIFRSGNDLVVPTAGVYDHNGAGRFPIDERLVLARQRGIHHSGYFGDREVRETIAGWLRG